jgi:glucosylceramidase
VILFDHNCDRPDFPLTLLNDDVVSGFAVGSGFHHYAGDMSAMSDVHLARPDKDIFFTEQMTVDDSSRHSLDITDAVKNTMIDAARNWSRNVILWNLAADPNNNPHTGNGGVLCAKAPLQSTGIRLLAISHIMLLPTSRSLCARDQYALHRLLVAIKRLC